MKSGVKIAKISEIAQFAQNLLIMVWVVLLKMAQFAINNSNCSKLLNLLKIGNLGGEKQKVIQTRGKINKKQQQYV